jgi:hypothetical protein
MLHVPTYDGTPDIAYHKKDESNVWYIRVSNRRVSGKGIIIDFIQAHEETGTGVV